MDTLAPPRGVNVRPIAVLLIIGALLAATLTVAYVASQRQTETQFGLHPNGRIFVATGPTITSFAADGSDPRTFLDVSGGGVSFLAVSPDGSRLAFWQGPGGGSLRIAPLSGGDPVTVAMPADVLAGDQIAWSPDSTSIVFPARALGSDQEFLYTARADGTGATRLGGEAIPATTGIWWPAYSPDGEWISFIGIPNGAGKESSPGRSVHHPSGRHRPSLGRQRRPSGFEQQLGLVTRPHEAASPVHQERR